MLFWNQWYKPYRIFYLVLLFLFVISILFCLLAIVWGEGLAFSWEVLKEYKPLELPLATIEMVFFEVAVPVEHYLVSEKFQGSALQVHHEVYVFLAVLSAFFLSTFIGILTTLSRFWYLLGMTVVTIVLLGLRLEQLVIFDQTENVALFLAILAYFPLSFYFHSLNKAVTLYWRILYLSCATLALGFLFAAFSNVSLPLLYIGGYGILVPLSISFIFIIIVSHDILAGFLNLITSGNTSTSKNSLLHFVTLSAIYLGWILLTYLHKHYYIQWDIVYLHPVVLLVVSALVGIWEYKNRNIQLMRFIPFLPSGAYLYLVLGTICFFTISALYLLANDPMIGLLENIIIYAHLGFGLMFFLYIIGNFAGPLQKNLRAYQVLYNPRNLPYLTTTIGGIILVGVLIAKAQLVPYYDAFSGYYNSLGDVHAEEEELFLGEQYYKLARSYKPRNYRSNYSLATLARMQGDEAVALKYFDDALERTPGEHAYINLANIYQKKSRFFEALFTLRTGLEAFPEGNYIHNNLGVLFSNTRVIDSAFYYLELAKASENTKINAQVNELRLIAEMGLLLDSDSLQQSFYENDYLPVKNNTVVALTRHQLPLSSSSFTADEVAQRGMNAEEFTYWYEVAANQTYNQQSAELQGKLRSMAKDSLNEKFQPELRFAYALHQYYQHNVGEAFSALHELMNISSSREGYYNYLLGLWAYEQQAYQLSVEYLQKAQDQGKTNIQFPMAVALTASGDYNSAVSYWNSILKTEQGVQQHTARLINEMLSNLSTTAELQPSDSLSFLRIYFDISGNMSAMVKHAEEIEDEGLEANAWLEMIQYAARRGEYAGLEELLKGVKENHLTERQKNRLAKLWIRYWTAIGKLDEANQYAENSPVELTNTPEYLYLKAKTAGKESDHEKAEALYARISKLNPFFEEGVIAAVDFYNDELQQKEAAYQILLDALDLNPYSSSLQKAYIIQCLHLNLFSYAENNLNELEEITPPAEYQEFLSEYQEMRDSLELVQNQWVQ